MEQTFELIPDECVDVMVGDYRYMATVRQTPARDAFVITVPASRTEKLDIFSRRLINVVCFRDSGRYSFVGLVGGKTVVDGVECVEVIMKSPISKYQRRDFTRLEVLVPIHIRKIGMKGDERATGTVEDLEKQRLGIPRSYGVNEYGHEFLTFDLSGGGVSFYSAMQYEPDMVVECGLVIKPGRIIYIDAIITRSTKMDGGPGLENTDRYMTCARFINIDERVRRKIIKFVFNEQRKRREDD